MPRTLLLAALLASVSLSESGSKSLWCELCTCGCEVKISQGIFNDCICIDPVNSLETAHSGAAAIQAKAKVAFQLSTCSFHIDSLAGVRSRISLPICTSGVPSTNVILS